MISQKARYALRALLFLAALSSLRIQRRADITT